MAPGAHGQFGHVQHACGEDGAEADSHHRDVTGGEETEDGNDDAGTAEKEDGEGRIHAGYDATG